MTGAQYKTVCAIVGRIGKEDHAFIKAHGRLGFQGVEPNHYSERAAAQNSVDFGPVCGLGPSIVLYLQSSLFDRLALISNRFFVFALVRGDFQRKIQVECGT